jgi:hypothetical protein
MRLLPALLACLPLLSLAALPVAAETRQHGNVIFDVPAGWDGSGADEDGTLTLWSDLPGDVCEYCRVYITPGEASSQRVDAWLADQTKRFVDPDDVDPPAIAPLSQTGVINLKGRPAAMLGQKVDDDLQMLFAVQLFGRMELVAFEAPAYDETKLTEAMQVFERDILPMLESTRFVSEGAEPLLPDPVPGDLSGVWWGTSTWWSLGLDGMMRMEIDHRWLTFWPDGTFYDGTAPDGTLALIKTDLLAKGDMEWGSYRVDGGKLRLFYASGTVEEFTITGETATQGDLTLSPVQLMADGTKIDGMVSTFFYSGFTPGSGISGGVSSATETHFHPDGTWDFGSSGGGFGSFDTGGGFATSSETAAAGQYEVKGGLVIRYDDQNAIVGKAYIYKSGSDIWVGSEPLKGGG